MKSTRQPPSLLTAIISPASAFVLIALLELTNAVTPAGYPSANVLPPPYKRDSGELEDMEFRVAVDPGKTECFFQDAKKDHQLEVTYTVIDISSRFGWAAPHSRGDLIIDFTLKNPAGQIIETDRQKMEGSHVHTVTQEGTFEICLDNSFSSVSTKLVNVEVYLYSSDDEDRWGYFEENFTYPPEVQAMESIESIKVNETCQNHFHSFCFYCRRLSTKFAMI